MKLQNLLTLQQCLQTPDCTRCVPVSMSHTLYYTLYSELNENLDEGTGQCWFLVKWWAVTVFLAETMLENHLPFRKLAAGKWQSPKAQVHPSKEMQLGHSKDLQETGTATCLPSRWLGSEREQHSLPTFISAPGDHFLVLLKPVSSRQALTYAQVRWVSPHGKL